MPIPDILKMTDNVIHAIIQPRSDSAFLIRLLSTSTHLQHLLLLALDYLLEHPLHLLRTRLTRHADLLLSNLLLGEHRLQHTGSAFRKMLKGKRRGNYQSGR